MWENQDSMSWCIGPKTHKPLNKSLAWLKNLTRAKAQKLSKTSSHSCNSSRMLNQLCIWPKTIQQWSIMLILVTNTILKSRNFGWKLNKNAKESTQEAKRITVTWLISCLWWRMLDRVRSFSAAPKLCWRTDNLLLNKLPSSLSPFSRLQGDKNSG